MIAFTYTIDEAERRRFAALGPNVDEFAIMLGQCRGLVRMTCLKDGAYVEEHVAVLGFAIKLLVNLAFLRQAHSFKDDLDEGGDTMVLHRRGDAVSMWWLHSAWSCTCMYPELEAAARTLLATALEDMSSVNPALMENALIQRILHEDSPKTWYAREPPKPPSDAMPTLEITYYIPDAERAKLAAADTAHISDMDIHYEYAIGMIRLMCASDRKVIKLHNPVLDFAIVVYRDVADLVNDPGIEFKLAESSEHLDFERVGDDVRITHSESDWTCVCPYPELKTVADRFLNDVLSDLAAVSPALMENEYIRRTLTEDPTTAWWR
jgi:hypothetical protein